MLNALQINGKKIMRTNWNENEKLARLANDIEGNAQHFIVNDTTADKKLMNETAKKFNAKVSEYTNRMDEYAAKLDEYKKYCASNLHNLEICPIQNNLIVRPFNENPFQQLVETESGLYEDLGGLAPEFKNPDNGNYELEDNLISVATVIEVGNKCEYIKVGDIVMYTKPSAVPIPFYKQNLQYVNENRVLAVINEGLTKRFNKE